MRIKEKITKTVSGPCPSCCGRGSHYVGVGYDTCLTCNGAKHITLSTEVTTVEVEDANPTNNNNE